jgi:hypothetical protein
MKTVLSFSLAVVLLIHYPAQLVAQVLNDYRSFTVSDVWTQKTSWQRYDGQKWQPATTYPKYTDGAITVSDGHTIVVDVALNTDQTLIKPGGTVLVIGTGSLTIYNGAGDDLVNEGTLNNLGTIKTADASAGLVISTSGVVSNLAGGMINMGANTKLNSSGILNNSDSIKVGTDAFINIGASGRTTNSGMILVTNGTFNNNGEVTISPAGAIGGLTFAKIINGGVLKNNGSVIALYNSNIYNYLTYTNKGYTSLAEGNIYNTSGTFDNEGEINLYEQVKLLNNASFTNKSGANLILYDPTSSIENESVFENLGTITIDHEGKLINKLTFNNTPPGKITLKGSGGLFKNYNTGVFTNKGLFTINDSAQVQIGGTFINPGDFTLH